MFAFVCMIGCSIDNDPNIFKFQTFADGTLRNNFWRSETKYDLAPFLDFSTKQWLSPGSQIIPRFFINTVTAKDEAFTNS